MNYGVMNTVGTKAERFQTEDYKYAKEHLMIFVFDSNCKYLYLNEAACISLGRPDHELIGKRISDLYPEILHTSNFTNMMRAVKGERIKAVIKGRIGGFIKVDYKPVTVEGRTSYIVVRAYQLTLGK